MNHHIMTVDVEDYYHVEAFSDVVERDRWSDYPSRVVQNTHRVLDLLDEHGVMATFFILGWVAERHPHLVRHIADRGHELGCHSYWHRLVYSLNADEFRRDTIRARAAIEDAAGVPVNGYRAPSYSITNRSLWALDVLGELGFSYDSSIFPIHHDVYGIPRAPRRPFIFRSQSASIVEFPITTFRLSSLAHNLPVGGGGYLRILPFWYTSYGFRRAAAEGVPFIVYIHPWELDPEQPRIDGRRSSRLRHYTRLAGTAARLRRLLALGSFTSFGASQLAGSAVYASIGQNEESL